MDISQLKESFVKNSGCNIAMNINALYIQAKLKTIYFLSTNHLLSVWMINYKIYTIMFYNDNAL